MVAFLARYPSHMGNQVFKVTAIHKKRLTFSYFSAYHTFWLK